MWCVLLVRTGINSVYQELKVEFLQIEKENEEKGKRKAIRIKIRIKG